MPFDLTSLSLTSWAGIAAAGALIGSGWRYIRMAAGWFVDLFICRVVVKGEAARAIFAHVWKNGKSSPFGLRAFGGIASYVAPKKRVEVVSYESVISEPRLFWFGRIPVVLKSGLDKNDKVNIGADPSNAQPMMLWYIRGTINADALIQDSVECYNKVRQAYGEQKDGKTKARRFTVVRMHGDPMSSMSSKQPRNDSDDYLGYHDELDVIQQLQRGELRTLKWQPQDLFEIPQTTNPFEHHPIPPKLMAEFDLIDRWLKHENWFRSRGIPWRAGYLLHGPTGTGKSTIVRNIALKYDLPVYSFDLSSYNNASFSEDWKKVMQNAPAIALFEDFDAVFDGRTNIAVQDKTRDGLTFDCLLNTISGVGASDGVLLFITTNRLDTLDEALGVPRDGATRSTRPGRIDRAIYVGAMEEPERRRLAAYILSDYPDEQESVVRAGQGETAAQFQERCVQLALVRWKAANN